LLPCQAVREHDFKLIADRMLDMSMDGVMLPLRRNVLTGETLLLSFALPGGIWIDTEATVARVVHGRRPGDDDGLAVGVVFDRIPASSRAALAAFLHGRRAPLPRRGPLSRLRRGEGAPELADQSMMMRFVFADPKDVEEDGDGETPSSSEQKKQKQDDAVDGLGVLRAVVGAWQSLIVSDGAANSGGQE
jgi:hypothetical protein